MDKDSSKEIPSDSQHPIIPPRMDTPVRVVVFRDTTIELSSPDDCFLTEVSHLILEADANGTSLGGTDLFSRGSAPWIWDTKSTPCFVEMFLDFTMSVWMKVSENERQLLASVTFNGQELYDAKEVDLEVAMTRHEDYPDLILKAKAISAEDIKALPPPRGPTSFDGPKLNTLLQYTNIAYEKFQRDGDMASLEKIILHLQTVTSLVNKNESTLPSLLSNLGTAFANRFRKLGHVSDINYAIMQFQAAMDLMPPANAKRAYYLDQIGRALVDRFRKLEDIADIDQAILRQQEAVDLLPDGHPNKPDYLNNLGKSFQRRSAYRNSITDINDTISTQKAAITLTPDKDPRKATYLSDLGTNLATRFERLGNLADIDDAITRKQAAVDLTPEDDPNKSNRLNSLGEFLHMRFQRLGNLQDLNHAVERLQAAVDLTLDGDPNKPSYLADIGTCLAVRFRQLGNLPDIEAAIAREKAAVNLTPDGHPSKARCLSSLGSSSQIRFERLGNLADVDQAIASQEAAIDLTPEGHPKRPNYLHILGSSLTARFVRLGSLVDIDNAIKHQEVAVELVPDGRTEKPVMLNALGVSLHIRFERTGNRVDIDNAIKRQEEAVELTPDGHSLKPTYLISLGNSFLTRFKRFKMSEDIDNGITRQQEAIELTPANHPERPRRINNLGISFSVRFNEFKRQEDLDKAIERLNAAMDLTPDGHPDRPTNLVNLASSILTRLNHSKSSSDLFTAISLLCTAATSPVGPPLIRLQAAEAWMEITAAFNHHSLLDACECAINLLPLVAWLGLSISDRHRHLTRMGGIARDAAAAAISLGEYSKALEWLEQGRSIVWTQILQLRTPVDRLRDVDSDLADRLLQVSRQLDRGSGQGTTSMGNLQVMEEEGRRYRALTAEWESIVGQVRALPTFGNFLKPPSAQELMNAAQSGPIVVLNIAKKRCDALAIIPGLDDVIHIPLPNITSPRVKGLQNELKDLLYSGGIRMRDGRAAKKLVDNSDDEVFKRVLAELWTGIVKPVMDSLAFSPHPDSLPRVWWCVTGPLAFLPVHAAGIYDLDEVGSQLSDYVISSYTPTLSALLESTHPKTDPEFKLLSVIQPSAPGATPIPNTKKELEYIRNRLTDREHFIIEGEDGTKRPVIRGMEQCHWLHLACHGIQRPDEPTKSALILQDGHLTLEKIIGLDLPKAEFAFLSACQTTTGDEKLSEEAVHIAGGMMLAGYRGVVATMWSIRDDLAPEVTDRFYANIIRDGERPDSRNAAEALHISVQEIRKMPGVALADWTPFVHLGA